MTAARCRFRHGSSRSWPAIRTGRPGRALPPQGDRAFGLDHRDGGVVGAALPEGDDRRRLAEQRLAVRVQQAGAAAAPPGAGAGAGPARGPGHDQRLGLVRVGDVVEVLVEGHGDHVVGPDRWLDGAGRPGPDQRPDARSTPAQWLSSSRQDEQLESRPGATATRGRSLTTGEKSGAVLVGTGIHSCQSAEPREVDTPDRTMLVASGSVATAVTPGWRGRPSAPGRCSRGTRRPDPPPPGRFGLPTAAMGRARPRPARRRAGSGGRTTSTRSGRSPVTTTSVSPDRPGRRRPPGR